MYNVHGDSMFKKCGGFFVKLYQSRLVQTSSGWSGPKLLTKYNITADINTKGGDPFVSCVHKINIFTRCPREDNSHKHVKETFANHTHQRRTNGFCQWKLFGHTSTSFLLRRARIRISASSRRLSQAAGRQRHRVQRVLPSDGG